MKKYIVSNPKILGGMPVISGTRVPIARVLFLLKEGYTVELIQENFPHVPLRNLKGAIDEVIKDYNRSQRDDEKILQT